MRVLVQAYTKLNVGDDLFLHTIFNRYPDVDFVINVYDEFYRDYRRFRLAYDNVEINGKHSLAYRIKRRLGIFDIDKKKIKNFDAVVHMSGSIFMENPENSEYDNTVEKEVDYLYKKNIPVYFLSCNFGPYFTQGYKKRKENMFKKCRDICFRDRYSYEMFAHLQNVRYAPDAVFSLNTPSVISKPYSLGISVINLDSRPTLRRFSEEYRNLIIKIAKEYLSYDYDVYLYSFCEFEGDGVAVDRIAQQLYQYGAEDRVHVVKYSGRMDRFLKSYLAMERTVCTRFHSMILSSLKHIPMLPIIYSGKVSNVVKDLNLSAHPLQINDLWGDITMTAARNITEIKEYSNEVFRELDSQLGRNREGI